MAYLIGTAGHVDHGKTTLIAALTGIDADRLPEEKARGMTIDLGFAFVELEGIGRVSIVDVPGHERFIKNMLAGASGVDVGLLCIAANEGVMPQTREHFQILNLLEARALVIALTKSDVGDPDVLDLAELDARSLLEGSRYEGARLVRVSAHLGQGIDELKAALQEAILELGERPLSPAWFLPIDRVFTAEGHGTIVTGTVAAGAVEAGNDGVLVPGDRRLRVRSVQTHGANSGRAEAGMRAALNVSGVKKEDLHRGQAIGRQGCLFDTKVMNLRLTASIPLEHGKRVRAHIGTGEFIGKLFLFDHAPGYGQLRLEESCACAKGQRVILRNYSPPSLLAGAEIITPNARIRRKNDPDIQSILQTGSGEEDSILSLLDKRPYGMQTADVCEALGATAQQLGDAFERLKNEKRAASFAGHWVSEQHYPMLSDAVEEVLKKLHAESPKSSTVPKAHVVGSLPFKWHPKAFDRLLARLSDEGKLVNRGAELAHPSHKVELSEKQAALLERVIEAMNIGGATAPSVDELAGSVGAPPHAIQDMFRLGIETGRLIRVAEGIYYPEKALDAIRQTVRSFKKPFTVAEFRDAFGTSRKFALPLLEYFDETRFTKRMGDERIVTG
jgi:selenocysteine-specific elongation factor